MDKATNLRLVAYLRDSGGTDQEQSLAQQEASIRSWSERHGHTITQIFRDEAISGTSTSGRHGFDNMIQHFRRPDCDDDGLVVWKFSRLARDFDDAQFYKSDLRRRGYQILAVKDTVPEGEMGRFFEAAIDWMNARYSADLATDIRRGMHYALKTYGCVPGHKAMPGFKRVKIECGRHRNGQIRYCHRWEIDPEAAEVVKLAFRLKASGATNEAINKACKFYSDRRVYQSMFRNPIYRGIMTFGRGEHQIQVPDYVEPIIDEELWQAVQAKLELQKNLSLRGKDHPRRTSSTYLLSGLLTCATCGKLLTGVTVNPGNGRKLRYYYGCRGTRDVFDSPCAPFRIPRQVIEDAVVAAFQDFLLTSENLAHIHGQATSVAHNSYDANKLSQLEAELKKVRRGISNLLDALAEGGDSKSLLQRVKELETRETKLAGEIHSVKATRIPYPPSPEELQAVSEDIAARLAADRESVRYVLRSLIKQIHVTRKGSRVRGSIDYYYPGVSGMSMVTPRGEEISLWA